MHRESQQLADAQERVRGLEEDLASTVEELHGETTKVEWFRGFLLQKASELNKRKEEEQISNSQHRKNLEEEWKTKLNKITPEWG